MASTTSQSAALTTIMCPACGATQRGPADQPTVCRGCGARIKPPARAQPPANPPSYVRRADPIGMGCWRVGAGKDARIVMPDGGSTPDRCVRCNAPARGFRKRIKFYQRMDSDFRGYGVNDAATAADALVNSIDAAVQFATRASGVVHLSVCPACRHRAQIAWTGAFPLALAALAAVILGSMQFSSGGAHARAWGLAGTMGGGVVLIGSIWWAVRDSQLLLLDRIVDRELWFKPHGAAFLASLPERPVADKGQGR